MNSPVKLWHPVTFTAKYPTGDVGWCNEQAWPSVHQSGSRSHSEKNRNVHYQMQYLVTGMWQYLRASWLIILFIVYSFIFFVRNLLVTCIQQPSALSSLLETSEILIYICLDEPLVCGGQFLSIPDGCLIPVYVEVYLRYWNFDLNQTCYLIRSY